MGPEFGSIDLSSEEGKKLLAAKSQHVGAVRAVSTTYYPCRQRAEKKARISQSSATIEENANFTLADDNRSKGANFTFLSDNRHKSRISPSSVTSEENNDRILP